MRRGGGWVWGWGVVVVLAGVVGCQKAGPQWYRGNLHTHTLWSDGDGFPESVAGWYRGEGYQFLALSDHNVMLEGERWLGMEEIRKRGAQKAVEEYLRSEWRPETKGEWGSDGFSVRLKTYDEVKRAMERPGRFVMIPGEEISDKWKELPLHMGAVNVAELIRPQGGETVAEVLSNNLRAVREQGERLNRAVLPHVNHPNFHYAITAEELAGVKEERFFEVYNGHPGVNHLGNGEHVAVERMWDVANTIRMTKLGLPPLMGMGCDDSHNYHDAGMNRASPGRGWIMVRAKELSAEAIIGAMRAGDFYASSGVVLKDVRFDGKRLEVEVRPVKGEVYTTEFIGTLQGSEEVGQVLGRVVGNRATYQMTGKELYVRAVVTSSRGAEVPVYEGQMKQAWVQPVVGR